ncbi:MAG: ribonuclease [Candidatus Binatota bacterium]|jgi:ribonuclease-3|nr:ribonuclease [Candidatus Binatota bacterium]
MNDGAVPIEQAIGYSFTRQALLATALTHRSAAGRVGANNEKLEFLGDAVLSLVVSELLMEQFAEADEGELSKLRASLVNSAVLARKADELALGERLRVGKGEEKSGGRRKESILASAYEAVIGAVFLDGGFEPARTMVRRQFEAEVSAATTGGLTDYKTRLQEMTQRRFRETPSYRLVQAAGPDHAKRFVSEILIRGQLYGRGEGRSRKAAEQAAAFQALEELEKQPS